MPTAPLTVHQFYSSLIDTYLNKERPNPKSQIGQLDFYKDLPIRDAIDNAVFGRYVVDDLQYFNTHFKYFPQHGGAQEEARDRLFKVNSKLLKAKNFMELYRTVRAATESVAPGKLALLFFYDTALRIGASKEVNLLPEEVFLQQGAYKGAKATGITLTGWSRDTPYSNIQPFFAICPRFRKLEAMDIETFLCVYKPEIAEYMDLKPPKKR
jgi:hypothetical protein